jgi:hypothetical protein
VTGKNRAIPGLHRDNFPGLSGQRQGRLLRQVTFTKLYCRAVTVNILRSRHDIKFYNPAPNSNLASS